MDAARTDHILHNVAFLKFPFAPFANFAEGLRNAPSATPDDYTHFSDSHASRVPPGSSFKTRLYFSDP